MTGEGEGMNEWFPLLPSPSPFHLFFCSRSNFRAITRLEMPATQANSQMAKKATSRLGNSLTGTPQRGKPFPLYGSRSKVCHHSCHPTKSCEIKKTVFRFFTYDNWSPDGCQGRGGTRNITEVGGTLASYTDTQLIFYTENLFRPKHRKTGGRGPTGPPLKWESKI